MLRLALVSSVLLCLLSSHPGFAVPRPGAAPPSTNRKVSIRFLPAHLPPAQIGEKQTLAVILRADVRGETPSRTVTVSLRPPKGIAITPSSRSVLLKPNTDVPVFFTVEYTADELPQSRITAIADTGDTAILRSGGCYDLNGIPWRSKLDTENAAESEGWFRPGFDDSDWSFRRIPSLWLDIGVTYLRTRLFVPESWRGRDVYLRLRAVDDADICYVNGAEIGRTSGWDDPRVYKIDPGVIRFGENNLICIAANNIGSGGGIYRSPNYFGVEIPDEPVSGMPQLAPAGTIGEPMPFRKMIVRDGVLLYADGGEVALWGANYYPQSWHQFDNMKRLGVDMKKAIRDDLDDMKRMGVEVIRIHVFDREISDGNGNIQDNEHLDLLDYLVSEGSKRGIYFFLTPIAWWWGPNQNPDSFSARTPKEFMYCDDDAIRAQVNYLKTFLNRTNRYTGKAYKHEPAICVIEIMNEPAYADYKTMTDPDAWYYRTDKEVMAPFKSRLWEKWSAWCAEYDMEDDARFFPLFRYRLMSDYLSAVYAAVRDTGAEQPVAYALFDTVGQYDLTAAIADSPCEAVTTHLYAGSFDKVGDDTNLLAWTDNQTLDHKLNVKARLVYEFDGLKSMGTYFYPAAARHFRHLGVQIAAMFQYDSVTTAEWNTDWDAHYLNWRYTPGKAVSFFAGGRVFRDLPRGATFPTTGDEQLFGNCAVSFARNISIYSGEKVYANSAPVKDWSPVTPPAKPETIVGVGDSPFAAYGGTGIYTLEVDYSGRSGKLTINPDAEMVGDPWHPDLEKSAVILKESAHDFILRLPGVTLSGVSEVSGTAARKIAVEGNTFSAGPGRYLLEW